MLTRLNQVPVGWRPANLNELTSLAWGYPGFASANEIWVYEPPQLHLRRPDAGLLINL